MKPLGAREAVVLILAAGVAGAMLSLAIAASVAEAEHFNQLSEAASNLLATALGAVIGVLAAYVGRGSSSDGDVSADDDRGTS